MSQRNYQPNHKRQNSSRTFNGRKHIDDMYDSKWESYRQRFLKFNSECYACGKPAVVVDHLKPHQGDVKLFKKLDNHIPLCVVCHNTVTTLFDRKYRAGNPITPKISWLNRKRIPGGSWNPKKVKVLISYEDI
jgi:5-methylcytosine-specific restriction endonuclease McrA